MNMYKTPTIGHDMPMDCSGKTIIQYAMPGEKGDSLDFPLQTEGCHLEDNEGGQRSKNQERLLVDISNRFKMRRITL